MFLMLMLMFQHTAARRRLAAPMAMLSRLMRVSTHSRPKAAGMDTVKTLAPGLMFQHTAARRRLVSGARPYADDHAPFQHTAARRRLDHTNHCSVTQQTVSTHSRPKAAGASLKSLAPSGFAALISLSSQEKRECEYNTAFSVTPEFAISRLLKDNPSSPTHGV